MLNKIIAFSIKNKLIIGLFTLALIIYGIFEVRKLPIDAVPDITDNQVQIITVSPSLGAPDVERFITFPLEQANNNIQGIKQIRSFSRFGLSVITIVFKDDVDIHLARQQVSERLQQVSKDIPAELGVPTMAPITTGLGEIYQYVVRPKKGYEHRYDAMKLRTIQDWVVRRQLLGIEGVADVASFGGYLKQYEIAINPTQLKAMGVTMQEVFNALQSNNQNTGGAYIEKGPTVLFIRTEGLVGKIEDIENTVVKTLPDGTPILVKNIGNVGYGSATRYGAMTYNGKGEVAGAVVMMMKGANSNQVIKNVKERIDEIQKTLPEGVKIEPFLDRTKMVNNAIGTVQKNLMEGALIVIFVLVLFLGNFRAGFLVASVIPLSMLFAIIMMSIFGVSGNLMSLGALDFGLIVDGAVIIVEAVLHKLHELKKSDKSELSQQEMNDEVESSAGKMMNSAVFGQIIILIVYLPILTLQGIEGKMFKPMAQTVAFALLGAFILSLTYVPMMSSLVLSKKINFKKNFSDKMMEKVEAFYEKTLAKILNRSKVVVIAILALFVFSVFILTRLGGEFIPSLPEGDFAVDTRVLTGSNLKTSTDAVQKSSQILLKKFPEIEKIVGKTGSSEIPTDPMPIDASDMMVILKPREEWTSAKTYEELSEKMSAELKKNMLGVTYSFQYPVNMRFNELMTGARQDVVCKIFGENLDTLKVYSEKLGEISKGIKGAQNIYVEPISGIPQIVISYNRAKIAQYGVNISEINRIVNTAFAGQSTGSVYEGEKRFDLVVRLSGEQRKNIDDVRNLLISTPSGTEIPLSSIADVELKESVNQIQRENAQRRIIVGFNVRNRDIQTTVADLQTQVEQKLKLPPGYFIKYGGTFENLQQAKARLSIAVPASLLMIFLMLYFAFRSIKYGMLIFTAIPLSAIGGILALWLRGMNFSISAGVGFIALFGVAVLNGIVLIAEFNRQKALQTSLKDAVRAGGKNRLRPVLMTAFVASLGFLPMATSTGEGAEVQRPLATVVIGGLLLATFLTLYLLPILYIWFESKKGLKIKKSKA
ncbi:efflux RND transporter permease subunit [Riemerella anatipestifer]|uniref:efflux RND transporter permease subunit n=1 Tax=Riemerella anatipestifer TaxID=34085 RepID=UPI0002DF9FA3|nr:CusA/CzcA family heavy metal efflux RND transporter [Riemerella anatipestifer]MRN05253.1 efflux RND transporter permease subunit [Riemerella anatipestifer]